MKNTTLAFIIALFPLSVMAGQTVTPLKEGSLRLKDKTIIARGILEKNGRDKVVTEKVSTVLIEGTVAQKRCGVDNCSGTLSVSNRGELVVLAKIDIDNDGQIDAKETILLGDVASDGAIRTFTLIEYNFVSQRYSWLEKLSGLKDSDWLSLKIKN